MYIHSSSGLPGNPIANAITIILGVLTLVVAFAFGFVLLTGFLIVAAVFVSFISLRLWWLSRKLRREGADEFSVREDPGHRGAVQGYVIDAEYRVLEEDAGKDEPRR